VTPASASAAQPAETASGTMGVLGQEPASEAAGLDLPAAHGTATLIAYGRVAWPQVTRLLTGAQAAWADYDGFHIGTPPQSPPPYSHLWAWTADWLARIRIDNQDAITGVLSLRAQPASPLPEQWRQDVEFRQVRSQTWHPAERRVGPLRPAVAGQTADLYLITGEHPVTFVRIPPEPDR
jgi:hypothetical protein